MAILWDGSVTDIVVLQYIYILLEVGSIRQIKGINYWYPLESCNRDCTVGCSRDYNLKKNVEK